MKRHNNIIIYNIINLLFVYLIYSFEIDYVYVIYRFEVLISLTSMAASKGSGLLASMGKGLAAQLEQQAVVARVKKVWISKLEMPHMQNNKKCNTNRLYFSRPQTPNKIAELKFRYNITGASKKARSAWRS